MGIAQLLHVAEGADVMHSLPSALLGCLMAHEHKQHVTYASCLKCALGVLLELAYILEGVRASF